MNERMKVLQMLQEGKITPEQADELLTALDHREQTSSFRSNDKWNMTELKNLRAQLSSAVSQSLGEVKKVIEQQVDHLPFGIVNGQVITASHEIRVPETVQALSVETANGRLQVSVWSEPYVRIAVRGQVKTTRMDIAHDALQQALQSVESGNRYDLVVSQGTKAAGNSAAVLGAHIDLFIPSSLQQLFVRTHNGGIYVDSISVNELHSDTVNGSVSLYCTRCNRIHLNTENGRIEIRDSVSSDCRQVYAFTKNGTITLEGFGDSTNATGYARTSSGRVDIEKLHFEVEPNEEKRPTLVRFRQLRDTPGDSSGNETSNSEETRIHLETKHGSIRVAK